MIGLMLLIIPGCIAMIRLAFGWQAILIEDSGLIDALERSWFLSKDNYWRLAGFFLAVGIFLTVVIVVVVIIAVVLFALILPTDSIFAVGLFSGLVYGLLLPLMTIPWTLLYYDLRVRAGEFGDGEEAQAQV